MMSVDNLLDNRYQLGEIIGEGSMGRVYRGLDTYNGQPVAVKRLMAQADDTELINRFRYEADALRQLCHPNIVKLLSAIEDDNRQYIVMEYVGGGSLSDRLDNGPLPLEDAIQITIELAGALAHIHDLQIIHRDLKPANVLLTEDGSTRLTDFGIARLLNRTSITRKGQALGTLGYVSPEIFNGDELDTRTDLWSLGVMMFEMLAGQRPFPSDSPAETMTAITSSAPFDLAELCPDAPQDLIALVYQLLEKDRNKRVRNAGQVAAALELMLHGAA